MLTKVGKVLRQIRLNNDEVLRDMAYKLNVSAAFLSAIENGKKKMSQKLKERIIAKYKLSEDEANQLDMAIVETEDFIKINTKKSSNLQKELAISFARSFESLNDEEVKTLMDYIDRIKLEESYNE